MITTAQPVFGQLAALADPTRSRILRLLERQPLSVTELCAVVQLPQSTVSRHLKVLVDEGWASARADGASRVYRLAKLAESAARIWETVRGELSGTIADEEDAERLIAVLEMRRDKSTAFFSSAADDWDRLRTELFASNAEFLPLLALLDRELTVADLGCGTGQLTRALAPFVSKVIGIDASNAMLARARELGDNVEYREGRVESLPLEDKEVDVALLFLVLHYIVEPPKALQEAKRILRPGGKLLIVDMMPHDREEMRETMGHVWAGFTREQVGRWAGEAGFDDVEYLPLPVDVRAKGPRLFVARVTLKGANQ